MVKGTGSGKPGKSNKAGRTTAGYQILKEKLQTKTTECEDKDKELAEVKKELAEVKKEPCSKPASSDYTPSS